MEKQKLDKKKIVITLLIIVLAFCGFKFFKSHQTTSTYITKPIERRTITEVVEASGTINPVNTVSVGSTVSGLISAIYVDFNSNVKKGQLLAEIDPRTFQASVEQNLASINNAKATLAQAEAALEMSTKTYNRYKNLYNKNFIPRSELDQAEADYKTNKAKVAAAKAQITQSSAQYQNSLVNLNYTKIISPVDGVVIARKIDLGQPVAASFQAPELFTIAQDLEKMQIEVSVSEADIGKVKEGQEVIYTLDGYPNSVFDGKVTQVRISPTTVSNVVTYSVIVKVDNEDLKLKPGMTANVSIITAKNDDVLCVPNLALKFAPNKTDKYEKQGIWLLQKGKLVRKEITVGASDESFTQVSGDFKEGDKVIVSSKNAQSKKKSMGPRM